MSKKRVLTSLGVFFLLALLAWLQFRSWSDFDWQAFWRHTRGLSGWRILFAVLLIYSTYFLRALRWRVLLRTEKKVSAQSLLSAQIIGFTAVAVVGRPGDLLRPYLVAKRHGFKLSSQLAIFAVERVFDTGCFALLLVLTLLFASSLRNLPHFVQFRVAGLLLCVGVVGSVLVLYWMWRRSDAVAEFFAAGARRFSPKAADKISARVRTFGEALHSIHDAGSFAQVLALSIAIWLLIAFAYVQVMNAYPAPLQGMRISHVMLAMAASITGSLLQLPVVGGGSQLGTIAVMERVLLVPRELAASCGIMLWLITFAAVVPPGLIWARFEQVQLRTAAEEAD